jgi:hypothetical protein
VIKNINSTNLNIIFQPFISLNKIRNSFGGLPDGANTTHRYTEIAGYERRNRKLKRKWKLSTSTCRNTESPIVSGVKGKSNVTPLHAWTDPEVSRRLKLPDFKTIDTRRWQDSQSYAPAAFTFQEIFLLLVSIRV